MTEHTILHSGFIHVDDIPDDVDFVAELRGLNDSGLEVPCMWSLTAGSHELKDPEGFDFNVGINGEIGALSWATNTHTLVPANGTSTDDTMYRLAGMHESYMPPGTEVPIETVYQAVTEFLATRQRPTCVEWRSTSRFGHLNHD